MKYSLNDVKYGGTLHEELWDPKNNPNATIANCLGNCTTLAYGLADIKPVSRIGDACNWHKLLTNGWTYVPFDRSLVKKGDIIEWVDHVHVATVDKVDDSGIWLHCSWYTGEHGVAFYNNKPDTRLQFDSTKEVSDFMEANYPTRMYHYWELDDECRGVGGEPDYLLVHPNVIEQDGINDTVDQIHVLTNEQNVRIGPSTSTQIVGVAQMGFYNVYSQQIRDDYVWYQIKNNYWIAGVEGRVDFYEGKDDIKELKKEIARLKKENSDLINKLEQINKLSEV